MMRYYDYLYYSIYCFYASYKEKGAASTSAGIIGGFQTINVITVQMFLNFFFPETISFQKWQIIILFLIFQITTYIRYIYKDSYSVEVIQQKWLTISERKRKEVNTILFLYSILSIVLWLALSIYMGSKK